MSDRSLPQRLTVAQIQAAVCEEFDINPPELTTSMFKSPRQARQVAMFLSRRLTGKSYEGIGRIFERDHATILWAVERVLLRMSIDPAFALRVTTLEQRLRAPEMVEVV